MWGELAEDPIGGLRGAEEGRRGAGRVIIQTPPARPEPDPPASPHHSACEGTQFTRREREREEVRIEISELTDHCSVNVGVQLIQDRQIGRKEGGVY